MKLWVDDLRPAPEGWYWAQDSHQAIVILATSAVAGEIIEVMSLDHDLGGVDTTRPVVLWCCENEFWPIEVRVHSANPPGAEWLEAMIERYHPSNAHKYTR